LLYEEQGRAEEPTRVRQNAKGVLDDGAKRHRPKGQKREKRAFLINPTPSAITKDPNQFLTSFA
jgi:hypothetical protein